MLEEKNSESLIAGGAGGVTGGGTVTVMRASATVFPPGPAARAMYVVDVCGLTVRLPEASTVPTPLSIVTPVAFVELQESVAESPLSIADGDTFSEIVGAGVGGAGGGGGVSFAAAGGGAGVCFLQLVPESIKAVRTMTAAANRYNELLIAESP